MYSGFLDLASVAFVGLNAVYFAMDPQPELWLLFAVYAGSVGGFSIFMLVVLFPNSSPAKTDTQLSIKSDSDEKQDSTEHGELHYVALHESETDHLPTSASVNSFGALAKPALPEKTENLSFETLQKSAKDIRTLYFADPFYWCILSHLLFVVDYGYYRIPTVYEYMVALGATDSTANDYNAVFSYILPG